MLSSLEMIPHADLLQFAPEPMKQLLIFLSALAYSATSAAVISDPALTNLIDPSGAEEIDYIASTATLKSELEALSDIHVLDRADGIDPNASSNIFSFSNPDLPDIRLTLTGGISSSDNIGSLNSPSYETSGTGDAFGWRGTDGQVVTIEFGHWDGSTFTPGFGVKAAGLTFANFGGAYDTANGQTITYHDASDNVLSTQVFTGGDDPGGTGGREAYSGFLSSSYNISKITVSITRSSGSSQIGIDDLAFTDCIEPETRTRFLPVGNYNVLFIPVDDLRVLVDVYGETEPLRPITPQLDRLASSSVTFANAHCQQAICNASRASVMTGLRPDSTRCWKLETFFRNTVGYALKTLPQHFAEQGYTTHGIGKIYHSTNSVSQDDDPTGSRSWNDGWFEAEGPSDWYERLEGSATDAGNVSDNAYDDGVAAEAAVAKIATYAADYHASGNPFFLAVGFKKPHLPFNAPAKYWDLYDPNEIDLDGYDGSRDMPIGTNWFTAPFSGEPASYGDIVGDSKTNAPNATDARRLIHGYLACVSYIDAQVGKLLNALEDPDGNPETDDSIKDSTVVVLWSDHGFFLGEHNGFWSKHSNYEIATRVPLIVRAPGMETLGSAGTFSSGLVELVDIYPTLVDLCSLPQPKQPAGLDLQGTSFLPLLEDPGQPWKKAAFSQYQRYVSDKFPGDVALLNGYADHKGMGYSIRTVRYRYTEWWRTNSTNDTLNLHIPIDPLPAHVELYDHFADPDESVNLAALPEHASLVAELSSLLNSGDATRAGDGWKNTAADAPKSYPDSISSWIDRYTFPGLDPSMLSGENDPDGDGYANLLEYKFGTHPLEPDNPGLYHHVIDGTLRFGYPEVMVRTDHQLWPEKQSGSLRPDSWIADGVSTDAIQTTGHQTWQEASADVTSGPIFLRLKSN
jgi:arylsulfatase A-like enzyme